MLKIAASKSDRVQSAQYFSMSSVRTAVAAEALKIANKKPEE